VKLLIGSDDNPIGKMGILEMEQFVLSGVSEMKTLFAATRNGAEMCGVLEGNSYLFADSRKTGQILT
jgi:imidazolonepropionase-like amidohydrolase